LFAITPKYLFKKFSHAAGRSDVSAGHLYENFAFPAAVAGLIAGLHDDIRLE
jgi:hypothetical protein